MDLEKALEEDLRRLFENEATRRVDKLILQQAGFLRENTKVIGCLDFLPPMNAKSKTGFEIQPPQRMKTKSRGSRTYRIPKTRFARS